VCSITLENALLNLSIIRPVYRKTQGCGLAGEMGQGQLGRIPKFLLRYTMLQMLLIYRIIAKI
jgi:hypothetical protein